MSAFGIASNSNGQFWYGNSINFPGFIYKKNVGVGARRSTKMTPGGNITCNTNQYIYNKYKPGNYGTQSVDWSQALDIYEFAKRQLQGDSKIGKHLEQNTAILGTLTEQFVESLPYDLKQSLYEKLGESK